jgi:hypothetical protein
LYSYLKINKFDVDDVDDVGIYSVLWLMVVVGYNAWSCHGGYVIDVEYFYSFAWERRRMTSF